MIPSQVLELTQSTTSSSEATTDTTLWLSAQALALYPLLSGQHYKPKDTPRILALGGEKYWQVLNCNFPLSLFSIQLFFTYYIDLTDATFCRETAQLGNQQLLGEVK